LLAPHKAAGKTRWTVTWDQRSANNYHCGFKGQDTGYTETYTEQTGSTWQVELGYPKVIAIIAGDQDSTGTSKQLKWSAGELDGTAASNGGDEYRFQVIYFLKQIHVEWELWAGINYATQVNFDQTRQSAYVKETAYVICKKCCKK
jgi:hypothetical protein